MEGEKGRVCVTGGTGFLASWLIMRLLQHGYSVNTTVRFDPEHKKDISYLTNLPGASERLQIFNADLDKPDSFKAPIEGCIAVMHTANPMSLEDEETLTKRSVNGTLGILQACVDSKTVKKVVYTSSSATVMLSGKDVKQVDETLWTDVDSARLMGPFSSYIISKTLTEKAALEFAQTHGLNLATVIPTYIHGPFVTPHCPGSVRVLMSMIFGNENQFGLPYNTALVHVDDVANAHIFLLEHPEAKGRYICSAVEKKIDEFYMFLSERYPEYKLQSEAFLNQAKDTNYISFSSQKLVDDGFKFKYGLEEMYDEAIQCCKQRGLL